LSSFKVFELSSFAASGGSAFVFVFDLAIVVAFLVVIPGEPALSEVEWGDPLLYLPLLFSTDSRPSPGAPSFAHFAKGGRNNCSLATKHLPLFFAF
jgi:hypothetical protein